MASVNFNIPRQVTIPFHFWLERQLATFLNTTEEKTEKTENAEKMEDAEKPDKIRVKWNGSEYYTL